MAHSKSCANRFRLQTGLWRALARNKSGNALVITGLAMPVLIGFAGLGTDTVQWSLWKRELQRSADSAALAGAMSKARSDNVQNAVTRDLALSNDRTLSATPTVETPPSAGAYTGDTNAVRVQLALQQRLPFTSLFLSTAPTIRATATAALLNNGNYCVIALENGTTPGVTTQGNATVNMGCGVATNSNAANGVDFNGGSSTMKATPVASVGGLTPASNYLSPTTLQPYSMPQADPFASLPVPAPSGCSGPLNVGTHNTQNITPGCWRGWNINGTLNLAAGIYYIDGGSVSFGAQSRITGSNVTIILTSTTAASNPNSVATLNINGGAQLNLSSSTSGTYEGVLFYQDRRAAIGTVNRINGNANSTLEGAFYFPRQDLDATGTAGMVTNCIQFVSRRIQFSGNFAINNDCPPGGGPNSFQGTVVRLVE